MSKKLNSCPFCGSKNAQTVLIGGLFQSSCGKCGASTGLCRGENVAVVSWNMRDGRNDFSKDPYNVDATHTDPGEIATALALAEKKMARIEALLKIYQDRDKQLEDILGVDKEVE